MSQAYYDSLNNVLEETKKCVEALSKIPLSKGFTQEQLWHIVFAAKYLNLPIYIALKGFYVVAGKIEMTSGLMAQIIRSHGHTIIQDDSSTETLCVLKGERKDNGNTWISRFSLEDAKRAGLYDEKRMNVWTKYPQRMLYARALSILARELFSDILSGFYVEGELSAEQERETPLTESMLAPEIIPLCEWVVPQPVPQRTDAVEEQPVLILNPIPEERGENNEKPCL